MPADEPVEDHSAYAQILQGPEQYGTPAPGRALFAGLRVTELHLVHIIAIISAIDQRLHLVDPIIDLAAAVSPPADPAARAAMLATLAHARRHHENFSKKRRFLKANLS
jgi:hypothetical protein